MKRNPTDWITCWSFSTYSFFCQNNATKQLVLQSFHCHREVNNGGASTNLCTTEREKWNERWLAWQREQKELRTNISTNIKGNEVSFFREQLLMTWWKVGFENLLTRGLGLNVASNKIVEDQISTVKR